eukprot:TRINITY_DN55625_c0_g1_i1.p1 TRINITY_DN55625_c0_g1~~TRINITY_DN55625_c0_g1_i1.p1  ORF type:complete len:310 (-),score=26.99 TRINITY_DN55625_c0_g1_i1:45-974(-)
MKWWTDIAEKIDAKTQRERIILALMVLAVIYALFSFLIFMPLDKEKANLKSRMKVADQEIKKLSTQELVLAEALSNDPNAVKKREIDRLEKKLQELDKNLQELAVGLIPADKLPDALYDVLQSVGSLKLVGMETLAASRLQLIEDAPEENLEDNPVPNEEGEVPELLVDDVEEEEEKVGVFKHSVVVAIEGKYFDVVSYLNALENLEWKIYWESVDYQVTEYPKARVLIEVYTLSTEEGVLGVQLCFASDRLHCSFQRCLRNRRDVGRSDPAPRLQCFWQACATTQFAGNFLWQWKKRSDRQWRGCKRG